MLGKQCLMLCSIEIILRFIGYLVSASSSSLIVCEEAFPQTGYSSNFWKVVTANIEGVRSCVYLHDDPSEANILDRLIDERPFYSVGLTRTDVRQFNGIYDYTYNDFITYEESKVYLYKVNNESIFGTCLDALRSIYFFRNRDKFIFMLSDHSDHSILVRQLNLRGMINTIFVYPNGSVFTSDVLLRKEYFQVEDDNYFYNKVANFQRQPIRISMFAHQRDAIPYKMSYVGMDGLLAHSFTNFISAIGVYIKPTDGIDYGENKGNGTITGAFGDVANNRSDAALNSRLMKVEFENSVEYTYPHGRDDLVLLVPCGTARFVIDFQSSFQINVWLTILAINMLVFVVFVWLNIFKGKVKAWLYTFAIFLGQPYTFTRTRMGRILVSLYTIYSFVVLTHYVSLLMSIIVTPGKPKEINTFEDLALSQIKIYTLERYKRYIILYGDESLKKLNGSIVIAGEKEIMALIKSHGDYAVICKRSVAEWAIVQRSNYRLGRPVYQIMEKAPFPAIVCYIVKYGTPLKQMLNNYVQSIVESGILLHWKTITLSQIIAVESKFYYENAQHAKKKISLDQMSTIFYLFINGCFIAIVAFICEVFYKEMSYLFV